MASRFISYSRNNGGRVLLLFLLFLVGLYQLVTAGLPAYAMICISPFLILFIYLAFSYRMFTFWLLFVVNYFLQMKDLLLPIPMSLPNEMFEILLLAIAIIDARQTAHFERTVNIMLLALMIWCGFVTLQVLNNTCDLGIDIAGWYGGARLMAFQLLYAFLVFCIYISTPEVLIKYLKIWAILSLFSAIWTWKQQYFGFTEVENAWIQTRGRSTHILQAGTLIRYFSTFSDAANYGCNAASAAVAFFIIGITSKLKKEKIFFIIVGFFVVWGMFASGTRTGMFCMAGGFMVYIILSKSFKIAIPFGILFTIVAFILIFTNIGQGNQQIRRMRSAFNKDDASANVRDVNKAAIKKYIADAPWGIGISADYSNVPANNKYKKLSVIPPDSEYVFIWVHTGKIGITIFIVTMLMMLGGACSIVFFKLKSPSLIGIGAGLCCAFVSIQLGGYANQILMQFPNCLIFYGGLSIVYILPYLEPAWIELENKRYAEQEERKRQKLEKKLASRV
jgi:hypothetical protein